MGMTESYKKGSVHIQDHICMLRTTDVIWSFFGHLKDQLKMHREIILIS